MKTLPPRLVILLASLFLFCELKPVAAAGVSTEAARKLLYVAEPGIRDYLEYGGHGVLVFDISAEHKFVRRIPMGGLEKREAAKCERDLCERGDAAALREHDAHPDVF